MAYRIHFGPLMSGGDRALTINSQDTGHYLGTWLRGTVCLWGPDIEPPRGKMSRPFESPEKAKTALLRALIRHKGNIPAALQAAACPNT